jgi:hypothetical protein
MGDLKVTIQHGGGGGGIDPKVAVIAGGAVLLLGAGAAVASAVAEIAVFAAVGLGAAVVAVAAGLLLTRPHRRRTRVQLQQARAVREADGRAREELRHQRRLEIAAASAPKVLIDASVLAGLTGATRWQPVPAIVQGEAEEIQR